MRSRPPSGPRRTRIGNRRPTPEGSVGRIADLPDVISRYQQAHDRRDTDAALAAFTDDARVADDGRRYEGSDAIRGWLDTAAAEFTYTRMLVSAEVIGDDTWLVVNHLAGDFPGSPVDLRYRFALAHGRIQELEISP